jgi:hypothetical protein
MTYARSAAVLAIGLVALTLSSAPPAPGQQSSLPALSTNHQDRFSQGGENKDPELDKLTAGEAQAAREVAKLAAEYAKTEDEAERAKIKPKLAAALSTQFDQQQKRRELELARAEAQLKKVRELMKRRGEERKTIIDKRLDQVLREAEGLGWSLPPGSRPQGGGSAGSLQSKQ